MLPSNRYLSQFPEVADRERVQLFIGRTVTVRAILGGNRNHAHPFPGKARESIAGLSGRYADRTYVFASGADFSDVHLANSELAGACLRSTRLAGANFVACRSTNPWTLTIAEGKADLSNANLYGANLHAVD